MKRTENVEVTSLEAFKNNNNNWFVINGFWCCSKLAEKYKQTDKQSAGRTYKSQYGLTLTIGLKWKSKQWQRQRQHQLNESRKLTEMH